MSAGWRRRFLLHLESHRTACAGEAVNRRTGQVPTPERYPAARRAACGPHLFDVVEPVVGVELPARVLNLPAWTALTEATADTLAWCNDLASFRRERAAGDVHDLVAVLAAADGVGEEQAAHRVIDRIAHRAAGLATAARTLADTLDRLAAPEAERAAAARVAAVLLAAPRAHLDWLVESGRYDLPRPGRDRVPRRPLGLRDILATR
jgi:hypothetical protein